MVVPHGSICFTTRIRWGFIVFDMFYKGLPGFGFSRLRQLTGIPWDLPADLGRVDLTLRGPKVLATLQPTIGVCFSYKTFSRRNTQRVLHAATGDTFPNHQEDSSYRNVGTLGLLWDTTLRCASGGAGASHRTLLGKDPPPGLGSARPHRKRC